MQMGYLMHIDDFFVYYSATVKHFLASFRLVKIKKKQIELTWPQKLDVTLDLFSSHWHHRDAATTAAAAAMRDDDGRQQGKRFLTLDKAQKLNHETPPHKKKKKKVVFVSMRGKEGGREKSTYRTKERAGGAAHTLRWRSIASSTPFPTLIFLSLQFYCKDTPTQR